MYFNQCTNIAAFLLFDIVSAHIFILNMIIDTWWVLLGNHAMIIAMRYIFTVIAWVYHDLLHKFNCHILWITAILPHSIICSCIALIFTWVARLYKMQVRHYFDEDIGRKTHTNRLPIIDWEFHACVLCVASLLPTVLQLCWYMLHLFPWIALCDLLSNHDIPSVISYDRPANHHGARKKTWLCASILSDGESFWFCLWQSWTAPS